MKVNNMYSLPSGIIALNDIYLVGANVVSKNTRTAINLTKLHSEFKPHSNPETFTNKLRADFYKGEE